MQAIEKPKDLVGLALVTVTVAFTFWMYGRDPKLPNITKLADYRPAQVTTILDANDRRIGEEIRLLLADLGHKVKVSVRMLDAAESKTLQSRSIVESTRESKYVERSKREKEAREHPIMKHVLQTFGAAIKEIKTDV